MDPARSLPPAFSEDTALFRRFNRMYTRFIGTLDEGLLQTEYSFAEARVLYEIAGRKAPSAKEIAEELNLDAGYLSRILRKFQSAGLIERTVSEGDGRYSTITLTRNGSAAFRKLNEKSEKQAAAILHRLAPAERNRLLGSMRAIEEVLTPPQPNRAPYVFRPHRPGDMGWVVHRQGAMYAKEYGWDETFEALVARITADFITNHDPRRERCWMAEADGQSTGHIFLVKQPSEPETAKLRLLFVEPAARGMGLGQALVNECVRFAGAVGYRKVVLWTQSILVAAHRIYEKAGFQLVHEEPHHSFGKDLVGQTWELRLG
jgi:DNA-binding MarR family transcriptional regulator/GNAT superfamily N-acetyltransferase